MKMGFTRSTTPTDVHQNMPDYPSDEGYTTIQLKTAFDAPATGLKSDINGLEGELEATTAAASLGAAPITEDDTSASNVQAKLDKLYQDLQDAALGEIPDNSITEAKLVSSYSTTLAKSNGTLQTGLNADQLDGYHASSFGLKNGNIQTGLNAEKLGGSTLSQVISTVNNRTSSSDTNYTIALSYNQSSTKTLTAKSRLYIMLISTSASFEASSQTYFTICDVRNKMFLLAMQARGGDDYNVIYSWRTSIGGTSSYYVDNLDYSSGNLSFKVTCKSTSGSTIYVKLIPLDGLLP
jgi:hypothetical protein